MSIPASAKDDSFVANVPDESPKGRFVRLFADERRFWITFTYVVAAVAFLKGARLPNLWSATQSQFDYSHGFIKRGLFGAFISALHIHHYAAFAAFSFALLFVFIFLLWRYAWRYSPRDDTTHIAAISLFFSSLALTHIVHLVGYVDVVLATMTVGFLFIGTFRLRTVLATLTLILGILMHEMFLVVFLPVIILPFVLESVVSTEGTETGRKQGLAFACLLLCIAGGVTLAVALRPSLDAAQLMEFKNQIAQRVDYPPRIDEFQVLARSARDNFAIMSSFFRLRSWWLFQFQSIIVFLPTLLVLVALSLRSLRDHVHRAGFRVLRLWVVIASVSPVFMNLIGWDVARWWALALLTAFLTMLTVQQVTRRPGAMKSPVFRNVAILVIALNLASGILLDDGYRISTVPFPNLVKSWVLFVRNHSVPVPAN